MSVHQSRQLLPMVRRGVYELLNGYIKAPEIERDIESYITLPALGQKAGIIGAIALAQGVLLSSENVTLGVQRICHPRFPALSMNCRYRPRQGWLGAGLVYRLVCSAVEGVGVLTFLSSGASAGAGLVVRRLPW